MSKVLGFLKPLSYILVYFVFAGIFYYILPDSVDKYGRNVVTAFSLNLIVIVSYLGLYRSKRLRSSYAFSFNKSAVIMILFVVTFLIWILSQTTASYLYQVFGDGSFDALSKQNSSADATLLVIQTLILAPVAEEMLCRGLLYKEWRRSFGMVFSGVLSSLVFAIMHGTLVHLPGAFLMGLICVLSYEYTKKIKYPIGVHILYNSLSIFLAGISLPERMFMTSWIVFWNGLVAGLLIKALHVLSKDY